MFCSVFLQNTIGHIMSNKYYNELEKCGTKHFELKCCFEQYPCECYPFLKNFSYICGVIRFCRLTLHIVKVFFASPQMKMWKFSWLDGRTEQHSLRVDTWDRCILHLDTPYLLRCGVLCRLFLIGSFHNLHLDKRKSAPHFLFMRYPDWSCRETKVNQWKSYSTLHWQ